MRDSKQEKPPAEIGDLIFSLSRILKSMVDARAGKIDLGQGQLMVLLYLFSNRHKQEIFQDELSKEMGLNKANVSRNLAKLKAKELVSQKHKTNAKKLIVELTQKGEEMKPLIANLFQEINGVLVKSLKEKELEITTRVLGQMIRNLTISQEEQ